MTAGRVLIVDDEVELCELLATGLTRLGHTVQTSTSSDEAFARVLAGDADVVLTDLRMRGMNGLELCQRIVESRPDVPVIVMTAFGSLETAIATIRSGATDFLIKPLDVDMVALAVERALVQRALRDEVKRLRRAVAETTSFDKLLGACPSMRRVYDLIDRVADTDSTVLITGESGTGKELVARSLHDRSARHHGPFVAVNCAALPEPLLESELFGHVKGAFTDAKAKRSGLLVEAHGGTLFFDEIGDMPLSVQAKLLRALETRTVRPIGASTEVPFDVRFVAATHKDLEVAVEQRRFREDLFYRLNVLEVELPALRARGSDVLLLAQHFLERFAVRSGRHVTGISPGVAERLLAYSWPGNVRELQNCMERAVALAQYEQISVDDLPEKVRAHRPSQVILAADHEGDLAPTDLVPMDEIERRYALRVLDAVGGNKNMAARVLGWDRKTLYRKLDRWHVGTNARSA